MSIPFRSMSWFPETMSTPSLNLKTDHRHLVGDWLRIVVELTMPLHGIGLFLSLQVLLVLKTPCKGGVARLPMAQGESRDTDLTLTRMATTHLLFCRYSIWPSVPKGQALYLVGAPWSTALASAPFCGTDNAFMAVAGSNQWVLAD